MILQVDPEPARVPKSLGLAKGPPLIGVAVDNRCARTANVLDLVRAGYLGRPPPRCHLVIPPGGLTTRHIHTYMAMVSDTRHIHIYLAMVCHHALAFTSPKNKQKEREKKRTRLSRACTELQLSVRGVPLAERLCRSSLLHVHMMLRAPSPAQSVTVANDH